MPDRIKVITVHRNTDKSSVSCLNCHVGNYDRRTTVALPDDEFIVIRIGSMNLTLCVGCGQAMDAAIKSVVYPGIA
jgi:hypothetical protein